MSTDPRRFVQPSVPDARVEKLWQGISAGLEQKRGFGFGSWVATVALVAAAAGALVWWRAAPQKPTATVAAPPALLANETKLETGAETLAVALVDGSALSLGPRSALRVQGNRAASSSVSLSLASGSVTCDVTHREGRRFSVLAGDVEIRVVGTKFTVTRSAAADGAVEVSVLRGIVEVVSARHPGELTRLAAGQTFRETALAVAEAAGGLGVAAPSPTGAASAAAEPAAPGPSATNAAAAASAASSAAAGAAARELFEKAGERRRAGDAAGAAAAYEELLRLHPSDGRASLSAFELGRLRMDRLGDSAGAISALERALSLNVGPSFREDALARLVSIYAAQGNFGACAKARDRYLSSYPAGVHAAAVTSRCGSR
jgi:TolA-binding protein